MATELELKRIAAKAAEDERFAELLDSDPIGTIEKEGVALSDIEKQKILNARADAENADVRKAAADSSACYIIVV